MLSRKRDYRSHGDIDAFKNHSVDVVLDSVPAEELIDVVHVALQDK